MTTENIIDLRIFVTIIRRRWFLIFSCFVIVTVLVITAISFMEEEYTAEARVLLDKKVSGAVLEVSQVPPLGLDKAAVESEIEILHSQAVMNYVLKLLNETPIDEETTQLIREPASGLDKLIDNYRTDLLGITNKQPKAQYFRDQHFVNDSMFNQYQELLKGLSVSRVGDSYVLRISYSAGSPELAARMANAFANAYIMEQRSMMAVKSDQTLSWFQLKLDELKSMAQKADKAVANFRLRYNTQSNSETSLNQLNVLVKESETYHQILNDYLDRYETMNQESSFPVSESRVISEALPPPNRSHPKVPLLLGASTIIALGLGVIIALFIDLNEKSIRRAGQLRNAFKFPFIGFVPSVGRWQKTNDQPVKLVDANIQMKEKFHFVINSPQGDYARAVRGMAAQLPNIGDNSALKIGITNMDSAEASKKLFYNLCEYLSLSNRKCIFIDANFSYSAKDGQPPGWLNLMAGEAELGDLLFQSAHSNLHILPAGYARDIKAISSISFETIKTFFAGLEKEYSFILVNLPDLKRSEDLQLISENLDGFFINLKWGKSTIASTQFYLQKSAIPEGKIWGTLLSDTNLSKLKHHYGYDA